MKSALFLGVPSVSMTVPEDREMTIKTFDRTYLCF